MTDPSTVDLNLRVPEATDTINAALERGKRDRLGFFTNFVKGRVIFRRSPEVDTTPLSTLLADWICDYLVNYSKRIDLGACVECGRIFSRQRRDNAYCSKTCQNRIAYKRKKIFETGLLKKIEITKKTAPEKFQAGLWVYHPRYALGIIEAVQQEKWDTTVTVRFPHTIRTFSWDFLRSKPDDAKLEFYTETDAVALAELL
jgi:hypothetical protein